MAEHRLTESQALARCDELGLREGRPREVYALHLATLWRPRDLAVFLQITPDAVYSALARAERAVKAWEEEQAEKRWREVHESRPGGMRVDCATLEGVNGLTLSRAGELMELIQNVEHCGAVSSGLLGKEGATIHVGKLARAKRLTVECVAQLVAGTMRRERTLFPAKRGSEAR